MYKFKNDRMKLPAYAWLKEGALEDGAIKQIENLAQLPFAIHHIAVMPDCHQGYGMPIGSVLATKGVIIPNAVGVDIGCGMCACKSSIQAENLDTDTLKHIISKIRDEIPVGFRRRTEGLKLKEMIVCDEHHLPVVESEYDNAACSLGTLGGGNHFIEIQKDQEGFVWFMLHSGSRNLGKKVADYYNNEAKILNHLWYGCVPDDFELAFLPIDSYEGKSYIHEMSYCIEYAKLNRRVMMGIICNIFEKTLSCISFKSFIDVAHNYARLENHFEQNVMVHRKGAISAKLDEIGIIPGSQGTASYIITGKGNKESFQSCSHGAGRCMGRKEATRKLDLEQEIKTLNDQGIIHAVRTVSDLEEAPSAYKNIDEVMDNQSDLVQIVTHLKPLAVIKG